MKLHLIVYTPLSRFDGYVTDDMRGTSNKDELIASIEALINYPSTLELIDKDEDRILIPKKVISKSVIIIRKY